MIPVLTVHEPEWVLWDCGSDQNEWLLDGKLRLSKDRWGECQRWPRFATAEPPGTHRGLKQVKEVTLYTLTILQYYSECCLHYARTLPSWRPGPGESYLTRVKLGD